MGFPELFLIALGLSMDAFAVAICAGLSMKKLSLKKSLIVGLYFGGFQGVMPLAGYLVGSYFSYAILDFDHWIAFVLLSLIGGKMIIESFKEEGFPDSKSPSEASLKPSQMLPLSIATSIDALAVGVSFSFLQVSIVPAVSFIGITTLALSMVGVKIGNAFGMRFKSKAELAGGLILVLMGLKILLEHLGILSF